MVKYAIQYLDRDTIKFVVLEHADRRLSKLEHFQDFELYFKNQIGTNFIKIMSCERID